MKNWLAWGALCAIAMAGLLTAPTLAQFNQMLLGKPPVAGATTTTQWDPANADASVTISTTTYTNDTAAQTNVAGSGGWKSVWAVAASAHSSGKYYLEFILSAIDGSTNGFMMGFTNGSNVLGNYCGTDINSIGIQTQLTAMTPYFNGAPTGNPPNYWALTSAAGDRFGVAIDLTNKLFWAANLTKASGWSAFPAYTFGTGNPANSSSGNGYPFAAMTNTSVRPCWSGNRGTTAANNQVVMITKTSSLVGSLPSGYSGWDP
jgi:hypothetical protein